MQRHRLPAAQAGTRPSAGEDPAFLGSEERRDPKQNAGHRPGCCLVHLRNGPEDPSKLQGETGRQAQGRRLDSGSGQPCPSPVTPARGASQRRPCGVARHRHAVLPQEGTAASQLHNARSASLQDTGCGQRTRGATRGRAPSCPSIWTSVALSRAADILPRCPGRWRGRPAGPAARSPAVRCPLRTQWRVSAVVLCSQPREGVLLLPHPPRQGHGPCSGKATTATKDTGMDLIWPRIRTAKHVCSLCTFSTHQLAVPPTPSVAFPSLFHVFPL